MAEPDNGNPQENSSELNIDPAFLVDNTTKEFFDEYVGPGKKYANIGELAKGYANADRHLAEVTRDSTKFKTEAEQLKDLLMDNIINAKQPENSENDPNELPKEEAPQHKPAEQEAPPKEDEDKNVDLKALVKEAMSEASIEKTRRDNALATEQASVKRFGSKEDALKAIEAKAEELGVSPQWIANLAFDSPKAYFATMGFKPDETPKSHNSPASSSDVNAEMLGKTNPQTQPNTYKWFMELRRTNPAKWRSQEIQQAILKAAQENPNFYS